MLFRSNLIALPEQSGTYYLIYQANSYFIDGYGYYDVYEVNTNNNLLMATAPVTVTYQVVPPDLAPVRVAAVSNSVAFYPSRPQNPVVPVVGVVTNQGPGAASNYWGFWYDTVYVSTNTSLSGTVISTDIGIGDASPLAPGSNYTETNLIALPEQSGTYYLIYQANSYFIDGYGFDDVYEVNTNNNLLVAAEIGRAHV